jgi:stage III sporulation protein SpoIIIAA
MVSEYIIDKIVALLEKVGVSPEEIQQIVEMLREGTREQLVEFLMKLNVPPEVIDYILWLLELAG